MKVLSLTRYSRQGASSRLRSLQYFPTLAAAGIQIEHRPLFDDAYLQKLYAKQSTGKQQLAAIWARIKTLWAIKPGQYDVIWLEKELLPWLPYGLERLLLPRHTKLVIDYDDAIFHNYDQHKNPLVRAILGRKIDRLMARADAVVGGSPYLCERARHAGARQVIYLPTVIDLERYPELPRLSASDHPLRLGWMGTPFTSKFLQIIRAPLQLLAQRIDFELLVVGGAVEIPGVNVKTVQWTESTEVGLIQQMDIGLMPLHDSAWEKGKCGYKLIQYMACGKAVVASPVGVNRQLVSEGVNGFCASSEAEWVSALERLLKDADLRQACGLASRQRVENLYCLQKTAPQLVALFKELNA